MIPRNKDVTITSIGQMHTTENGNMYLVCELTDGKLAVWGSARNNRNIELILEHPLPCQVTLTCIADRQIKNQYWVPESAVIELKPRD